MSKCIRCRHSNHCDHNKLDCFHFMQMDKLRHREMMAMKLSSGLIAISLVILVIAFMIKEVTCGYDAPDIWVLLVTAGLIVTTDIITARDIKSREKNNRRRR